MAYLPIEIIKITRPVHWVKNLSVFAALLFSGSLFNRDLFNLSLYAFVVFSVAVSATYVFNDLIDASSDRLHPIKKHRPVASGSIHPLLALSIATILAFVSLYSAAILSNLFFILILSYLVMQFLYSLGLKNIAVVDILIIASGFILRVYAGAVVIDAHLSVWFLLCVVSTALFLASGKRRAELNLIISSKLVTRKSLSHYQRELLNSYVTMFGNASWMSWALFTFFESPKASLPIWLLLAEISKTTTINKLLMITTPIVIFGIMRYQKLIFEGRSEAPEKLFLTDIPLVASVILWTISLVFILYSGVSVTGV
ncbi:hypothetical protein A2691_02355 [Candidatus Woesebacteria bacterium RIFCSPHIGHO2_01_FULL_39_23]|nr:MAG: hypothetical protein A2691_02355 [Candidatus Woesebacteria bacterium RIFCSPHIGHO2_01_FULL_39_23]